MMLSGLLFFLLHVLCSSSQADLVRLRAHGRSAEEINGEGMTMTRAIPTSMTNNDAATIPTPISTALPTSLIPLYIPQLNPTGESKSFQVSYLGPANGGSTIYQVVMQGPQTDSSVTATLFEDATNAKLLGGQEVVTIDGMQTAVYAAASCGFQDGLDEASKGKAAGLCYYWHALDHSTVTWTSAVTQLSAQTSVKPALDEAVQSALPLPADVDEAKVWANSALSSFLPSPLFALPLLFPISALFL